MKLYHYITKGNTAKQNGILSFAQNPHADLSYYYKRSGVTTHAEICQWLENCFAGRSRGIRFFTEPVQYHKDSLHLKQFLENTERFTVDIDELARDGLVEAVYVSPSVADCPEIDEKTCVDEVLKKIYGVNDIDYSPIDWSICNEKLQRRFAYIRYYLVVVKNGIIPPKYLIND